MRSAYADPEFADLVADEVQLVAGIHFANALWRPGVHHVAGIESVVFRRIFDQFANAKDLVLRVGILFDLAIDRPVKGDIVRVGDFVRRDDPGTEDRIPVTGLPALRSSGPRTVMSKPRV